MSRIIERLQLDVVFRRSSILRGTSSFSACQSSKDLHHLFNGDRIASLFQSAFTVSRKPYMPRGNKNLSKHLKWFCPYLFLPYLLSDFSTLSSFCLVRSFGSVQLVLSLIIDVHSLNILPSLIITIINSADLLSSSLIQSTFSVYTRYTNV